MKKWWYAVLAGVAALAFHLLSSSDRTQKKLIAQRDDLILDGSGRAKEKARKKGVLADKHQKNSVLAAAAGKKAMDKAGTNESTADLLDSWRKPVAGL